VFQSKADLGTHLGYIKSKCIQLYPYGEEVGSDWVYKVYSEGRWTDEPSLKCTKAPRELPLSEILRKLSDARARRHRGIPPPFVATFGPLVASIRAAISHGYGNGDIPPHTARAWDVLHTNPQRRAANMDEIQGIAKILKEGPQVLSEVHGETATETSRPQISRDSQAAKLLQEKQELVSQQAVASPVDEARLMAAIAERDAARRAYMESVATEAQQLLTSFQAASLEGLRAHAETAAREATESAKILSQAKATAVQALRQDWLDKGVSSSHMLWQCMDIVHGLQNQNGPLREGGAAKGAGSSGGGRETLRGGEALSQCKAVVRDYLVKHTDARATEHLLKSDQLLKLIVDIYVFGPATLSNLHAGPRSSTAGTDGSCVLSAFSAIDQYEKSFEVEPEQQAGTDLAALNMTCLHGSMFTSDMSVEPNLVSERLRVLNAKVDAEICFWQTQLSAFPLKLLLQAGSAVAERRHQAAASLQSILERCKGLSHEHAKLSELLETRVNAFEEELMRARNKVELAKLDLEEEGTKLKRAKLQSGNDAVEQRAADVKVAKGAVRAAEGELSQLHATLFKKLNAFPELRRRVPDGIPVELLPLYKMGRQLDQYTELRKLQTFSRHPVWIALLDGRAVALKKYDVDAEALKVCYKEAALLLKCQHPAVVELEALFESDDSFYLQMPYYPNGTLSTVRERAHLTARFMLELLLALSEAVANLHARGVIHSDIKPDNILFDEGMRPRLADFDVSVPATTRRSRSFVISTAECTSAAGGGGGGGGGGPTKGFGGGTFGFFAPEVVQGTVSELTSKSDVYSLGKSFEWVLSSPPPPDLEDEELVTKLLRLMMVERPEQRPSASEVAIQVQQALAELVVLEAERARRAHAASLAAAQKESSADRAQLHKLQASLKLPDYWQHSTAPASAEGVALVALEPSKHSEAWDALSALLETDGTQLGKGRDYKHQTPNYDRLRLAAAWRIEHQSLFVKYAGARNLVAEGLQRVLHAGKPVHDVKCRLHDAASRLPGQLDTLAGEEILLHATAPENLLSILSSGLNEHFSGTNAGTAFGDGLYFAEDAGKCDHYATIDIRPWQRNDPASAATRGSAGTQALHQRLYPEGTDHPGRVFYLLACRVATGCTVRTLTAHDKNMKSPDTSERIFPMVGRPPKPSWRELAPVGGVDPPVNHHTLVAENHAGGGPYRYREFIVFQNAQVYPEYLIAYQRFDGILGPQS